MANTTITYNNPNRPNANKVDNSNRFKINNAALNMMARNPSLGIGYIIGNMLGENYWGKKRNKSSQDAVDDFYKKNGIGADSNGVYGVNNSNAKTPSYEGRSGVIDWDSMNKALDNIPRTPQQANKPAVTTENAGTTGGVPTVADAWNNMVNGSAYNPGNTTLFTNGARNMGNVIGADANGVYGVPGANPGVFIDTAKGIYSGGSQQPANPGVYIDTAKGIYPGGSQQDEQPAGPTPYTDDQLRQIQGQNFTAEELAKMASPDELARMVVMMRGGAPVAQAPAQAGGGLLSPVANSIASSASQNVSSGEVPLTMAPANTSADDMRLLKGDSPSPTVYDYSPGYTNPQDMTNLSEGQAYYDDYRRRGSLNSGAKKLFDDLLHRKIFG